MALRNLAQQTTTTVGTGTITLGPASAGFLTFSGSGATNGETVPYGIIDGYNSEGGNGVYTTSGTYGQLVRVSVLNSTNSNSAISLSGNNAIVSIAPNTTSFNSSYVSTIASASTITPTVNGTYLLTGTTSINTITGITGGVITLVANGQATGIPVVINHLGGNIKLRDSANFGIYAGESLTFVYDGYYWNEISRNLKSVIGYTQFTANVSITGTTEAGATTIVSAPAITFDGATAVIIDTFAPYSSRGTNWIAFVLYEDASSIGLLLESGRQATTWAMNKYSRRLTPSAASHTYSWRAFVDAGTGTVACGAGGSGAQVPGFIQICRSI